MSAWNFIQRVELGSSTTTLALNNIPQTYDDLVIFYSTRVDNNTGDPSNFYFGTDSGNNYAMRMLFGTSSVGSAANANRLSQYNNWAIWWMQRDLSFANTFNNVSVYIPNYSSTTEYKTVSVDAVGEDNAAGSEKQIGAGIWRSNSPVTAVTVVHYNGNFVANSSATVYGIKRGSSGGVTVS